MNLPLIADKIYQTESFPENFREAEYDSCSFKTCNFTSMSFAGAVFSECEFIECDLSNINLRGTTFRDVTFTNCKLMGLRFEECDPFLLSFSYTNCNLSFSSFYKLKIKNTRFINCVLTQVDYSEANLEQTVFKDCDLDGAIFQNTNLKKADLRLARNFSINPQKNSLTRARFSSQNIAGLLDSYQIIID
ncbi:pentapeptide repeat-containing protein [Antarcticibacterium flavum]|uniref:Pentapeptide repeat-containing protein n=1 Tax=Antarcticibacterium flavum TaxID=2058175 RepID=A0A5B7X7P5_9FLAO|nr:MULTISPECIES: pentapeptide repeat-containing protein [Antarcticibacterium]MCM4159539.1 hypothetical protein [Antarcticibacterium sp. W02-3]QCY70792.1 pentapeptide repeat-containing protein [Antarcticibacterium flavum]